MSKFSGLLFLPIAALTVACSKPDLTPARGHALYLSYGCAACHGAQGRGDGPGSAAAMIKPPDLRADRGNGEEEIIATIRIGVPGMGMPGYAELDDDELRAIARWIQSIQKEKP